MTNKQFSIQEYLQENKIHLGSIEKEVGDTISKGGHNDLRKTKYDVRLDENGKLDLYTHKTIITESTQEKSIVTEGMNGVQLLKAIKDTGTMPKGLEIVISVGGKEYKNITAKKNKIGELVLTAK